MKIAEPKSEDELIALTAKALNVQVCPDGFIIWPEDDKRDEEVKQSVWNAEYKRQLKDTQ